MAHQVPWCKVIVERFIDEAALTEDEVMVLRTRVAGWSRSQQADTLGLSLSSIDRIIRSLKRKYDRIAKVDPILPPRKFSAREVWMDEN